MSKVHWQAQPITKADRVKRNLKGQRPALVWLTGLSGSGKSALAAALELELFSRGLNTYSLDGDNVRHGLCRDLGFTEHDRNENIRRVGEVAALMVDAGLIVIASFISPFRSDRQMVRQILEPGEFIEVYLNAPLKVCEQRDPKGLYRKARAGEIKDFTGISSPYEPPETPEVIVDSSELTLPESVALVIDALKAKKAISV